MASILIGKPVGILSFIALGVRAGLHRPTGVGWGELTVGSVAAAIGFTVALFFTTAAFPPGPLIDQAKMGALLSFVAAPMAVGIAAASRIGRGRTGA